MIEDALVTIASADAGVSALIGDPPRFYAGLAPEQPTYPYCVYYLISGQTPNAMGQSTDLERRRYQVDCWGKTATDAITLADAIEKAFDRYSGVVNPGPNQTTVQAIFKLGPADVYDEQARRFKRSVDLDVCYQES